MPRCPILLYATRYDLHDKALLKTNPKEYVVDTGFGTWMAGYRITDTGRLFENAVYLQLLYEGWSVHVGKLYGKEVTSSRRGTSACSTCRRLTRCSQARPGSARSPL